jgi:hypothetical protein
MALRLSNYFEILHYISSLNTEETIEIENFIKELIVQEILRT